MDVDFSNISDDFLEELEIRHEMLVPWFDHENYVFITKHALNRYEERKNTPLDADEARSIIKEVVKHKFTVKFYEDRTQLNFVMEDKNGNPLRIAYKFDPVKRNFVVLTVM